MCESCGSLIYMGEVMMLNRAGSIDLLLPSSNSNGISSD